MVPSRADLRVGRRCQTGCYTAARAASPLLYGSAEFTLDCSGGEAGDPIGASRGRGWLPLRNTEYSGLPIEARLSYLDQTPGELERAISGKTDNELSARPDAHNWAAKEIVCHLRDVEELFQIR